MKKLTILLVLFFINCTTPDKPIENPTVTPQESFTFAYKFVTENNIKKPEIGVITYNQTTRKINLADAIDTGYNIIGSNTVMGSKRLPFGYENLPAVSTSGALILLNDNQLRLEFKRINETPKVRLYEK
jgi:hypothetical protein